jgi:hypothetical protein
MLQLSRMLEYSRACAVREVAVYSSGDCMYCLSESLLSRLSNAIEITELQFVHLRQNISYVC